MKIKTQIMFTAVLALTTLALAGCKPDSSEKKAPDGGAPAVTNAASDQMMPEAGAAKNDVTPPVLNEDKTNAPAATNDTGIIAPAETVTNQ